MPSVDASLCCAYVSAWDRAGSPLPDQERLRREKLAEHQRELQRQIDEKVSHVQTFFRHFYASSLL